MLVREWFPAATYQLDHYHLKVRLGRWPAPRSERGGGSRGCSPASGGASSDPFAHLVARGTLDPKTARETRAFLEANHTAIWAFRGLLSAGAPPELCTRSSGVVEHTVDLVVARRMKRRGMYWSVDGATHLLMLRALLHDPPPGAGGGRR